MKIKIARIYDLKSTVQLTGYRILVDRLWPRGISKAEANLDDWCKDIAPSNELREWFGHIPERYPEFKKRYVQELNANPDTKNFLQMLKMHQNILLLYGARDEKHNQAVVLHEYILKHI